MMKLETTLILFYLTFCLGFSGSLAAAVASSSYVVPTFTVHELQDGSRDTDLLKVLTSTGLLAIRVPILEDHLSPPKEEEPFSLLSGGGHLCKCKDDIGPHRIRNGSAEKILLKDGLTTRSTIATATSGLYKRLPLPKDDIVGICGEEVYSLLERAREYVSRASNDYFIPALDRLLLRESSSHGQGSARAILTKSSGQGGYESIYEIVQDAVNLEHFHSYSKRNPVKKPSPFSTLRSSSSTVATSATAIDDALDWHTDGGLFLSFLPAKSCNDPYHPDDSFVIKLPGTTHSEAKVIFPQDRVGEVVVGIMLGIGAEEWLNTSSSSSSSSSSTALQFRATRHAVKMSGGDDRVWYGKMHLVSPDAIVYKQKEDKEGFTTQHVTFSELRKTSQGRNVIASTDNKSRATALDSDSMPLGHERQRRLQHVGGPNECNNINSFYCWLSCLDIPSDKDDQQSFEYHTDDMGESLYCLDPSILARTNNLQQAVEACSDPTTGEAGGVMNVACGNYWHATVDGVPTYTSLYAGSHDDSNSTTSPLLQYCYGKTGMYMQGFEWEATTCIVFLFSSWVISTRVALFGACIGTILLGMLVEAIIYQRRTVMSKVYPKGGGKKKMILSAILYGAQLTFSYLVMLLVMTYSLPIFMSVVLGLVTGHVVFNWADIAVEKDDEDKATERNFSDDNADAAGRECAAIQDSTTTTIGEQQHRHCGC